MTQATSDVTKLLSHVNVDIYITLFCYLSDQTRLSKAGTVQGTSSAHTQPVAD